MSLNPMDSRIKLLIVDNEARSLNTLSRSLNLRDFDVTLANAVEEVVEIAKWREFDLALVNPHLPGLPHGELLRRLLDERPELEVIVLVDRAAGDALADPGRVLHKPVETLSLLQVLREAYQQLVQRKHALSDAELQELLKPAPGESSQSILRKLRALDVMLGCRRRMDQAIG